VADAIIRSHPLQSWSFTAVEAIAIPANGAAVIVEFRAPGGNPGQRFCGVAAAGSLRVAGVARHDVPAARATIGGPQVGEEHRLTVASGVIALVTFSAAVAEGDALIVGAVAGRGSLAGATPDARTLIGRAMAAAGAGATGLAYIKPMGI
jgi:hypothetical protein